MSGGGVQRVGQCAARRGERIADGIGFADAARDRCPSDTERERKCERDTQPHGDAQCHSDDTGYAHAK